MTTSIVRIGPTRSAAEVSGAQLLRAALVSHWKQRRARGSSEPERGDGGNDKRLPISNKYFSADVLLEDMESETEEGGSTTEDSVFLVFDMLASNPDRSEVPGTTFDSLQAVHGQAQAKDTCGDLLRLCIGVSLTALSPREARGEKHEEEYSRRVLWCLDNGYEYIEADLSREGRSRGHEDRDKDGFARVVEAIQGTVWSGAVMKERRASELLASYGEGADAIAPPPEAETPYVPPDPSIMGLGNDNDDADAGESNDDHASAPSEKAPTSSGTQSRGAEMERLRREIDEEKVFDEMESVLREASRIREQSKCGALTDDERRAKAESAALRLVDLMNQFGMEEEEEEDDDGGEGNSIAESDDSGIVDAKS